MPVTLRRMSPDDLPSVSELGIRSKASWGYDDDMMSVFAAELTLTRTHLSTSLDAQVAVGEPGIVGYFTLSPTEPGTAELEHLFIHPDHLRRGIGTQLLREALASAARKGITSLTIVADPNSTGFYTRHGATITGEHASSIPGRTIPVLEMEVAET